MSTTTEAPVVDSIALTDLIVKDGFNPRGEVDKESVKDLVSSIKQDGILQPVLARRDGDGVILIAGHRRVFAAIKAGLKSVPVLIREDITEEDAASIAFDENEQRESMVPMARATALRHQFKKLGSYRKVGARRSMNAQQVSALVKMCDLPESVQEIAMKHREFGPELAKALVEVANVPGGEPVTVLLATQAMESPENERLVRTNVAGAIDHLIRWRQQQDSAKARDTAPFAEGISGLTLVTLMADEEKAAELEARAIAAHKVLQWDCKGIRVRGGQAWDNEPERATLSVTDAGVDRLRASKVLFTVEYKRNENWTDESHYVFDVESLRTEVEQTIEQAEKETKAALKRQEADTKREEAKKAENPAALDEKGEVKSDHQMQKEAAAKARVENEAIGQALLARSTKPVPKKTTLELTRLMALVFIRQSETIAGIGMRLCFASWKDITEKELKSGAKREKIEYLSATDATERLISSIESAKTLEAIHQIISDAIVAATFSNEDELPKSKRLDNSWSRERINNVRRAEREFIDGLGKGVLPEEVETERLASIEKGYKKESSPYATYDDPAEDEVYEDGEEEGAVG